MNTIYEGYKTIIIGDLNADSSRLKYTTDRILKKWFGEKKVHRNK